MLLDSEQDKQLLLAIMKDANIKGAMAVPFAMLMDRVARSTVLPAPAPEKPVKGEKAANDAKAPAPAKEAKAAKAARAAA